MTDKLTECQTLIATWYLDQPIVTIALDPQDSYFNELCMQMAVIELLRQYIDNPIPTSLREGSPELITWAGLAYKKAMDGANFGFNENQVVAIMNLAFNYYTEGVSKTLADPSVQYRLFKCWRGQLQKLNS